MKQKRGYIVGPPRSYPKLVDIDSDISSKDEFNGGLQENLAPDSNEDSSQETKSSPASLDSQNPLDGWMEATDPSSGNTYYYNRETRESS